MKAILAILVTIILGVGLGVGIAKVRIQNAKWTPTFDDRGGDAASSAAETGRPAPSHKP
jgi:hypothetical protein